MSTVPPQDLARALGIQEDSDDLLPGSIEAAERISKILADLPIDQVEVFWLSFSSLYLPKFLLFFQQSPSYDPFHPAHYAFLSILTTALLVPHLSQFFREHPEDACGVYWWALFVLASFPEETFESPQLTSHLHLTLILLENLTTVLLSQLDPTLFLPTDPDLSSAIFTPLASTLPHFKSLFKTTPLASLTSTTNKSETELLEIEARLKELTWLIEDGKEGALQRRQQACVKGGYLGWWRCPRETWMERDGGGGEKEGGCRQIEYEEMWAPCLKCETVRYCCQAHLELSAPEHARLCFRPEW